MTARKGKLKVLGITFIIISLLIGVCALSEGKEKFLKNKKLQTAPLFGENPQPLEYVPGQVLVKFKPSISKNKILSLNQKLQTRILKEYKFPNGLIIYLVALPQTMKVQDAVFRLKQESEVEYAEPDYKVHILTTPNDPYFNDLWGLNNTGQTGGTADVDIDAPEAWDISTGSEEIVIADIDTGIDINHPDLAQNIWTNPGEIPGNGIDDDGNGYVDDVHGWDFANEDNTIYDGIDDHGTHTAGTIGAVGNNGVGVCGVNWNVKIMPLKFLENGTGNTSDAIEAFAYVANMGVKITSNSWGYVGPPEQALMDAMQACNALHICAAGNDSIDNDAGYPDYSDYPASFPLDNIISVAATDHNDELAYFSNWGANTVDLAAPGVDIKSTVPTDKYNPPYASFSGTSMATPHVAGVCGLLMAKFPDKSLTEIKQMILGSVDQKESLQGLVLTNGRLNAYRALSGITAPIIDEASATPTWGQPPLTVSFTGSAHDLDGTIVSHQWDFGDGATSNEWNPTHTYQEKGEYIATLEVTDNDGTTSSRSIRIHVIGPANVLLVDDDGGENYESYFISALEANGLSYEIWSVANAGSVPLADIASLYNVIIWTTGDTWESTLTSEDQANLSAYLDAGGKLFLSSQDLLWDVWINNFVKNYLHISNANEDIGANKAMGINGDSISNGLDISLNYPFYNFSDNIIPDSSATGIFTDKNGKVIALKYAGDYRLVFFAFPFEAIPSDGTYPNNSAEVMRRIYNWLTEGSSPPPPSNNPPSLSWTGEAGYESDGLEPESGTTTTSFEYRIKYTDSDNNPPQEGYPKVHILKGGQDIEGSPFSMSETNPQDTDYTDGKLYHFTKQNLTPGSDYTYYFEAEDAQGASAMGEPTSPKAGPEVIDTTVSLTLTAPNGGETLTSGSTYEITWASEGSVEENVKLEYSTNSGGNWTTIASTTPNDGSYTWTVPDTPSSHCLVKVSSLTTPSIYDVSDGEFFIVSSNSPATATRVIFPGQVEPGATFEVTVTITANQDINGFGLDENLQGFAGDWSPWQVTPIDNDGATFNASEVQWVWMQVSAGETKTVRYMVTVPSNLPGDFTIEGKVKSFNPQFERNVEGDDTITVPVLHVTRTIEPDSVLAGGSFNVTVNIEALCNIQGLSLDENLQGFAGDWSPWQVTPIDNDGAIFDSTNVKWTWQSVAEGDVKTIAYRVNVPENENSGTYNLEGTVSGSSPQFTYSVAGESSVEVDHNLPPVVNFTYIPESSDGPHTDEGISFTNGSYDPDGSITSVEWQFGDGETSSEENPSHTYSYSPSSPVASAATSEVIRSFNASLVVTDNYGAQSSITQSITVYLNIPRVVANYFIADNLFDFDEILQAISWWSNEEEVPFTNGRKIDMSLLLEMIAKWAQETPVNSSLSTTKENPEQVITVTRKIFPEKVMPGESFKVTIFITANEDIYGLGLDEGLSGLSGKWGSWQVKPVDNQDATFNPQEGDWVWISLAKENTKTLSYEVKVPEDAIPGEYKIEGTCMSYLPRILFNIQGDSKVTVISSGEEKPFAYPNPCDSENTLKFSQIPEGSRIYIYTVSGEEVANFDVPEGETSFEWDLYNEKGEKVERGVYIYLIISPEGKKYTGKVAIIK